MEFTPISQVILNISEIPPTIHFLQTCEIPREIDISALTQFTVLNEPNAINRLESLRSLSIWHDFLFGSWISLCGEARTINLLLLCSIHAVGSVAFETRLKTRGVNFSEALTLHLFANKQRYTTWFKTCYPMPSLFNMCINFSRDSRDTLEIKILSPEYCGPVVELKITTWQKDVVIIPLRIGKGQRDYKFNVRLPIEYSMPKAISSLSRKCQSPPSNTNVAKRWEDIKNLMDAVCQIMGGQLHGMWSKQCVEKIEIDPKGLCMLIPYTVYIPLDCAMGEMYRIATDLKHSKEVSISNQLIYVKSIYVAIFIKKHDISGTPQVVYEAFLLFVLSVPWVSLFVKQEICKLLTSHNKIDDCLKLWEGFSVYVSYDFSQFPHTGKIFNWLLGETLKKSSTLDTPTLKALIEMIYVVEHMSSPAEEILTLVNVFQEKIPKQQILVDGADRAYGEFVNLNELMLAQVVEWYQLSVYHNPVDINAHS